MTEPRKAKTGEPMDDDFWRRTEEKANASLDPSRLHRRVGRPTLGDEPAELTAVRLPREVRRALDDRAAEEHTSASEVIGRALDQYLASYSARADCSTSTIRPGSITVIRHKRWSRARGGRVVP